MGVVRIVIELRDYQLELIDGVYNSLRKRNKRIMVVSPAGSGKTVTMSEIARRATDKKNRVLFVVHRIEIVQQARQTFIANDVDMNYCEVGMIQTISNKVKKDNVKKPTTILIDEAHHSLSKTYIDILDAFPDAVVLGFTATPTRLSNKGFTEVFTDLILGKSVKWLIENERLAPFKYYSVNLINSDELKKASTGDYKNDSIDKAMKPTIYGDVVENYRKFAEDKKTIIYTHNIESSIRVAEKFNQSGYRALQVDGKTPKDERHQAMELFRSGKVKILVNAELYGEGVDVPDCQCVILLRPTKSLTLFIQQTMRSMRYQPNKTAIIIDHVGNYMRHGLPDYPHNWNKYFKGHKKKKNKADDAPSLTTCDECYTVYESEKTACPACGHVNETEVKESEMEHVEAELTEIDPFEIDYTLVKYSKSNIDKSELKTLEDYYLYAKANGYKETWIKFNYPTFRAARITFPAFYAELKPIKQKYNY
ncbi:DEAD/DEAH box helicase [Staphylococcus simulans]|uniref:DEAD/DEAH box helicase n=1 Tax=Staphylococcus simulans TaxID=1286 RepID=UPI000D02BD82|nr:DEAD/DEAH box helicase [Staphylococcus simulans]